MLGRGCLHAQSTSPGSTDHRAAGWMSVNTPRARARVLV